MMMEKLLSIIKTYTGKPNIEIDRKTALVNDIGLSSFDLVQLVCLVEDEFDIEISDKEIRNFKTVGDVIDYIERQ